MDEERTIFISYRREDSAHAAGRLYDRLSQYFGSDNIFMDMDTIELGDDFVNVIEAAVRSCDVLVTIIGNKWLTITNEAGQKRLDDPNDFVRLEIASALNQDVDVVPILLDDAVMPRAEDLPETLVPFIRRNALAVEYSRFNADVDRLIRGIEAIFTAREEKEDAELELAEVKRLVAERTEANCIAKKQATTAKKAELVNSGQAFAPAQDAFSKKLAS